MSAGVFLENQKYETDAGFILKCRVQPETALALLDPAEPASFNVGPDEPVTEGLPSLKVSQGKSAIGIWARRIRYRWGSIEGTSLPAGYEPNASGEMIIFSLEKFQALNELDEITYLGNTATILKKYREVVN
jgi:hypothetical protein